jgi:Tol biopolymer transport system component
VEEAKPERAAPELSASHSSLRSRGAFAGVILFLLGCAFLAGIRPLVAQSASAGAGVRLEAGIEKEDVDGDLKSAMEIYQKIALDGSAPREVRAKALLRLAGCDEKLGRQAGPIYEQIVRDYADQPAAAQARKRLALLKQHEHPAPPMTMNTRKINWSEVGYMGSGDTDGQRAVYRDSDGNLFFGDLSGRSRRMIFKVQPDDKPRWIPSRDLSMVALGFAPKPNRPSTLAVIKTDGTGYRELGKDDQKEITPEERGSWDANWSWDNRSLVAYSRPQKGGGHLMIISIADGQRRDLLRIEKGHFTKAVFSPDNRFIAYEVAPSDQDSSGSSHIFILPTQGGEPHLVYESDPRLAGSPAFLGNWTLRDWTADGRYLAITDRHFGESALYLLPVKDGALDGKSTFVRYGEFEEGYTTPSGVFVYEDHATQPVNAEVFLTSLDSDGYLDNWSRLELRRGQSSFRGQTSFTNPWPSFSPDGRAIAYVASGDDPGKTDLILRELSTGNERVLYQFEGKHPGCQFSDHQPKIFCTVDSGEGRGKTDLVSVGVQSGSLEHVGSFDGSRVILRSSPDDRIFYFSTDMYRILGPVVLWDLAAQQETIEAIPSHPSEWYFPSFDGRWLVRFRDDSLSVRSMSGSDWRSLVSNIHGISAVETTPDGNWILYCASDPTVKGILFRVPVDGGAPQRMGDLPTSFFQGSIHLSRDGIQILAVNDASRSYDLWALDNFEPPGKNK